MERKSFEKDLHLVLFLPLLTDSKPEWPGGSALWELTGANRAEIWEQSNKESGWEILALARPCRSATMCSDKRQVQIDCWCKWLRQHRNTWVFLSLTHRPAAVSPHLAPCWTAWALTNWHRQSVRFSSHLTHTSRLPSSLRLPLDTHTLTQYNCTIFLQLVAVKDFH